MSNLPPGISLYHQVSVDKATDSPIHLDNTPMQKLVMAVVVQKYVIIYL